MEMYEIILKSSIQEIKFDATGFNALIIKRAFSKQKIFEYSTDKKTMIINPKFFESLEIIKK